MFRKNVAGQHFHFQGIDSATGGIKSGVTWTVRRCIDGTFAAATGTVTEDGTAGWYKFALSQADSNGNNIGFNFTGTGAIPQTVNIITTAADPTDTVRFGLTALPNAAAEDSGGLPTLSAAQASNGTIQANVHRWLTGTPNALQTGRVDSYLGAVATGVIAAASFAANALDAVWGATTRLLTAGTNIVLAKGVGVTGFNDLSAAQVNAEVDTALSDYDGPTHAEMTAELATADDATLAAIAALNNPTVEQIADSVWERVATIPFPSTTVLDNFNRGDESPVTGWTKVFTSDSNIELVGNQITGALSSRAVFAGLTPADDQEVYLDVSAGQTTGGGSGNRLYLLLRVTGETSDAATGYFVMVLSSAVRLYRFDSFASIEELAIFSLASVIMEGDPVLMAGDQIGARVRGNVFEVWVNIQGAGWTRIITATDSTYPSGKIGLGVGTLASGLSVDNFGGGDFVLPVSGADVIADAVWDENIVAAHTTADSAGNKLNQALILYEGN